MSVRDNIEAGVYQNTLPWKGPEGGNQETVRKAREAYRAEERRLKEQFRQDLAIEHGVFQHHKEPLLFELAWSEGHSAGYPEVCTYYERMVELIQP